LIRQKDTRISNIAQLYTIVRAAEKVLGSPIIAIDSHFDVTTNGYQSRFNVVTLNKVPSTTHLIAVTPPSITSSDDASYGGLSLADVQNALDSNPQYKMLKDESKRTPEEQIAAAAENLDKAALHPSETTGTSTMPTTVAISPDPRKAFDVFVRPEDIASNAPFAGSSEANRSASRAIKLELETDYGMLETLAGSEAFSKLLPKYKQYKGEGVPVSRALEAASRGRSTDLVTDQHDIFGFLDRSREEKPAGAIVPRAVRADPPPAPRLVDPAAPFLFKPSFNRPDRVYDRQSVTAPALAKAWKHDEPLQPGERALLQLRRQPVPESALHPAYDAPRPGVKVGRGVNPRWFKQEDPYARPSENVKAFRKDLARTTDVVRKELRANKLAKAAAAAPNAQATSPRSSGSTTTPASAGKTPAISRSSFATPSSKKDLEKAMRLVAVQQPAPAATKAAQPSSPQNGGKEEVKSSIGSIPRSIRSIKKKKAEASPPASTAAGPSSKAAGRSTGLWSLITGRG
jgi:hypothetical protein